ncbi:hypothetical protein GGS26DRAFT_562627 [Hypomontagnella submonticulosa]|nr:hypothetical protein GGS26DRAFT_562627 [Hypomontagnella submonticulosa]
MSRLQLFELLACGAPIRGSATNTDLVLSSTIWAWRRHHIGSFNLHWNVVTLPALPAPPVPNQHPIKVVRVTYPAGGVDTFYRTSIQSHTYPLIILIGHTDLLIATRFNF